MFCNYASTSSSDDSELGGVYKGGESRPFCPSQKSRPAQQSRSGAVWQPNCLFLAGKWSCFVPHGHTASGTWVDSDNQESEILRIWGRSESLNSDEAVTQCRGCVCWGFTCPLNHDLFRSIQTVFNLLQTQFDKSRKRSVFSQGTLPVNISSPVK